MKSNITPQTIRKTLHSIKPDPKFKEDTLKIIEGKMGTGMVVCAMETIRQQSNTTNKRAKFDIRLPNGKIVKRSFITRR